MKNKKLMLIAAISAGLFGLAGCGEDSTTIDSSTSSDNQIYAVYENYQANGGSLSYEEWLASIKGEKGDTGATGAQGEKGEKGEKGDKGDTGAVGADGKSVTSITKTSSSGNVDTYTITYSDGTTSQFTVTNGQDGAAGAQGEKGEKGDTGATGAQGEKGEKGDTGATGAQGEKGEKGDTGAAGAQGEKGEKGDTGAAGAQGEKGEKGDTGATGAQGEKGEKGDTGAAGAQGEKGEKGDTGAAGAQGEKGEKGDTGEAGAQGEKGEKGDSGRVGFLVKSEDELAAAVSINNSYVMLLSDISLSNTLVVNNDVTINLNGKTITNDNETAINASGEDADVLVANGKVISNGNCGLTATDHAKLTVDDVTAEAQEACLVAYQYSTLIVNSGNYTSRDNFVVGTNGTVSTTKGDWGHNTIQINGGEFNGNISTKGFIACGVYVANSDDVCINGGTFNITDGVGVLARSGKTIVKEDVKFNFKPTDGGITAGWVGDTKINVPTGYDVVRDDIADYPGGKPSVDAAESFKVHALDYVMVTNEKELRDATESTDNTLSNVYLENDISIAQRIDVKGKNIQINL